MRTTNKVLVLSLFVVVGLLIDEWREAQHQGEVRAVARLKVSGKYLSSLVPTITGDQFVAETILVSDSLAERARLRTAALYPEIKATPIEVSVKRTDSPFPIFEIAALGQSAGHTLTFLDCLMDEFRELEQKRRQVEDAPVYSELETRKKRINELQSDLRARLDAIALAEKSSERWKRTLAKEEEEYERVAGRQSLREDAETVTILDRAEVKESNGPQRYGLFFAAIAGAGLVAVISGAFREHCQIQGGFFLNYFHSFSRSGKGQSAQAESSSRQKSS
jgi:hypothetical protein